MLPANLDAVVIRYLSEHDREAYIALETNSVVKRYVGGSFTRPVAELRSELSRYEPNIALLTIVDSTTDRYICRCGLLVNVMGTEAKLHCLLEQSSWGKGIGPLVVRFLVQLAQCEGVLPIGVVDPENIRSLKMMERLGWNQTGVVSQQGKQFGHLVFRPN